MRKIVFYTTTVLELGGGHEKSIVDMAKNLATDKNYSVTIITMDEKFAHRLGKILNFYYMRHVTAAPLIREKNSLILERLGRAKYYKCSNFHQLSQHINNADIVISKNEILESVILRFFVKTSKQNKLVYDCATCLKYPMPETFQERLHNWLYLYFPYPLLANNVNTFVVKNHYEEQLYKRLFPKSHIELRYNQFEFVPIPSSSPRISYDFNSLKFNILWVGRLTNQKGIDTLAELIHASNVVGLSNYVWHIVGDGEEKRTVERLAESSDNVKYYGHIENNLITHFYEAADAYVSTSKFESFGNTLVESISQNTPVISRNIPGPSDIIIEGVNGYFANSIAEFLEKLELVKYSKNKFKNIKHTVIDKFSQNELNNFSNILNKL